MLAIEISILLSQRVQTLQQARNRDTSFPFSNLRTELGITLRKLKLHSFTNFKQVLGIHTRRIKTNLSCQPVNFEQLNSFKDVKVSYL